MLVGSYGLKILPLLPIATISAADHGELPWAKPRGLIRWSVLKDSPPENAYSTITTHLAPHPNPP